MSEAKHTPGPWQSGESDDFGPIGITAGPFDMPPLPNGIWVQVAKVNRHGEQTMANAKLIAAAPDLLEACRRALDYIADDVTERDILAAAIRKATGG